MCACPKPREQAGCPCQVGTQESAPGAPRPGSPAAQSWEQVYLCTACAVQFFLVFPQISAKSFWKIPGWLSCAENRGHLQAVSEGTCDQSPACPRLKGAAVSRGEMPAWEWGHTRGIFPAAPGYFC